VINANAINTVTVNGAPPPEPEVVEASNLCTVTTKVTHRKPGSLNAAVINGGAVNAATYDVIEESQPGYKSRVSARVPGTINGLRLNIAAINAGYTEVTERCIPGCILTTTHRTRAPGTFNGFALNSVAVNDGAESVTTTEAVGKKQVVTERSPGTINGLRINSTPFNAGTSHTRETCVPLLECYTVTVRRPGGINTFVVNGGTFNGTSTYSYEVCEDIVTEPDTPSVPQQYYETITAVALAVGELEEEAQTMYLTNSAVGHGEIVSEAQVTYYTSTALATEEISTVSATSATVESYALASAEIIQSQGRAVTLESLGYGYEDEPLGSRGQYDTFISLGYGSDLEPETTRGYLEELTVVGLAFGDILRAGNTQFETVEVQGTGSDSQEAVRRVFEPIIEDLALAVGELALDKLSGFVTVESVGWGSETFEDAALRVIRDTIEAVAVARDELLSGTLAASAMLESYAKGSDYFGVQNSGTAWVFNTRTYAMSRYEGFEGSQALTVDGEVLAPTATGLKTYGQGTAEASVEFGLTDFESRQLKSVPHVYFTLSSQLPVRMQVRAGAGAAMNEVEYERAIDPTAPPATYRMDLNRGEKAQFWGFKLLAPADAKASIIEQRVMTLVDSRRV